MTFLSAAGLRSAARSLMRAPAITASAILCLGLGLGTSTAISSAIDRALLQRPPFRDPESLVQVYRTTPHFNTGPFSAPNYTDLARETHQLSALAALSYTTSLLTIGSESMQVPGLLVSGNFFTMLGVTPQAGRLLTPSDDAADQNRVVVLSDELWRTRFGATRAIVGTTIQIDGNAVTVVGIAPREFRIPRGPAVITAQVWMPLRFTPSQLAERRSNFLPVLGRLAPGATAASAQKEFDNLFNGLVAAYPQLHGEGIRVMPMMPDAIATLRTPLLLIFGAVIMVLLIAVTDVAALLLARSVYRRRDTAIRSALGGSRWAVVAPVVTESLLLTAVGVAVGLGLAWVGVRTIGALAGQRLPQLAGLSIDLRVIGFAVLASVVVAVACALIPAWRTSTVDPQDALRDGRGGGTGRKQIRALGALVVAEVALSLILMIGAGLVLRGFSRLISSDPGFRPESILALSATISPRSYPESNASIHRFLEPALAAVEQIPGVEGAGAIQVLPYQNWGWNFNIRYEGQPGDDPTQQPLVETRTVTPSFFKVTQQRLIAGRLLQPSDDERDGSPYVVVVNQALVARDFKGVDPIGKRFYTGDTSMGTIVGVVSDIRNVGPFAPPAAEMYATYRQNNPGQSSFPILVRVRGTTPGAIGPAVQRALRGVDPLVAVTQMQPMTEVIANSVGRPRFYLTLLGTFAVVAVILAIAGLYGVMSYAVAQRTRELGIRNALGSSAPRSVVLVASQGLRLVGIGVALGLAGSVALTRLLTGLLYGVSPLDPAAWIGAAAVLAGAALAATVIPALRAVRVDPLIAMRSE